ncbi:uncharacterized protein MONOS_376 [Monocercomonoides exilis]|uniref:uncharacterized protein n=1 Tax=Monocercomonoides exilis TaxID=2049356 RepID=UPI003559DF50|nr:hypothetical protein MONOS_376 [Monocercomonoides exilis]|eukprot:MONOS_376.1-p1 / transcript=MONOS_376.1 / gene=MONOS_376 / organism=Monocercomonoides_exilis_PA203 / gene_product=unspecified product / transcript_product=unspecified product / location=Mono_scaffold00006:108629-112782(-) / protein_length=1348 / sequence_SO=supercontig / SO=protein_coding / is_pseudo=false
MLLELYICCLLLIETTFEVHKAATLANSVSRIPKSGSGPTSRQSPVLAADGDGSSDTKFYCFSGFDTMRNYQATIFSYDYSSDKNSWIEVELNGVLDSPYRACFASFVYKNIFYVWGGKGQDGFYDDLWCYNLNTKSWFEGSQSDERPSAREFPHCYFDNADEKLYLFGGRDDTKRNNDVWTFSPETGKWTQLPLGGQDGHTPGERSGGGCFKKDNILYVFGGFAPEKPDDGNIIWKYDVSTESWVDPITINDETVKLNMRTEAGISALDDKVYIFGGVCQTAKTRTFVSDMLVINFSNAASISYQSYPFNGHGDLSESELNRRSCGFIARKIQNPAVVRCFAFGGVQAEDVLGDMICATFNGNNLKFERVTEQIENQPPYRTMQKAVPALGKMWVYGGIGDSVAEWQEAIPLNDMYSFDFSTEKWEMIDTSINSDSDQPPPLSDYSLVEHSGRLFIFGGLGTDEATGIKEAKNDIYEYSILLGTWHKIVPTTAARPSPRSGTAAVVLQRCIIIIGGRLNDQTLTNEIWRFSLVTNEWTLMNPVYLPNLPTILTPNQKHSSLSGTPIVDPSKFPVQIEKREHHQVLSYEFYVGDTDEEIMKSEKYQMLIVAGGVSQTLESHTSVDRIVIPPMDLSTEATQETDSTLPKNYFYFSTQTRIPLNDDEDHPLLYRAYATPVSTGIISLGGLDEDYAVNELNFIDFTETMNPVVYKQGSSDTTVLMMNSEGKFVDTSSLRSARHKRHLSAIEKTSEAKKTSNENSLAFPYVSGGSVVYFGKRLYCYAGNLLAGRFPSDNQFHNQLYVIELNKDFKTEGAYSKTIFGCSLGTYVAESTKDGHNIGDCVIVKPGYFTRFFNTSESSVVACYSGSFNKFYGGSSGYHCVACSHGTYSSKEGSSSCVQCDPGKYCPVGSKTDNSTAPSTETLGDKQPKMYETKDQYATTIMIACYAGGLIIGLILAFIMVCCPCRKFLFKLDLFSDKHQNKLDPITNSAPKVLRKSRVGGFVTLIYLGFALGAGLAVILEYALNRVTETKSVISSAMEPSLRLQNISVDVFKATITLSDYHGGCVAGVSDSTANTDWGECSPEFIVRQTNLESIDPKTRKVLAFKKACKQTQSSNMFLNEVSKCDIQITGDNTVLYFETDGSKPVVEIMATSDDAHAYGLYAEVAVDTGIQHKDVEDRLSSRKLLVTSPSNEPFKGSEPTIFQYTIMPSLFTNTNGSQKTGYQIVKSSTQIGSTASEDEMHVQFGLHAKVILEQDLNVLMTNWVERQKFPAFFANLMSTMMGFMGIFGSVVLALEIVTKMKLPCAQKLHECMFGKLLDDNEQRPQKRIEMYSQAQTRSDSSVDLMT